MLNGALRGISSMATRQILAELASAYRRRNGVDVAFESVGGVDAARRVRCGEPFDVAVLAADAIDGLVASGHVLAGSRVDIARSAVAIAVRADAARPDVATADALRRALLAARSVGYSTGPSGAALLALLDRWGIAAAIRDRLVQAPAGVPVATLVARGEVELGFQQSSELLHAPGIALLGPMPTGAEIVTTFSGAVCATSTRPADGRALLDFLCSAEAAQAKRRHGMEPA